VGANRFVCVCVWVGELPTRAPCVYACVRGGRGRGWRGGSGCRESQNAQTDNTFGNCAPTSHLLPSGRSAAHVRVCESGIFVGCGIAQSHLIPPRAPSPFCVPGMSFAVALETTAESGSSAKL
jgi:hypothetical protein